MLIPLQFIRPNQHPIWENFQRWYDKNPILIEKNLIIQLIAPLPRQFIHFATTHAQQILKHQDQLKSIDMGDFGLGVITTEAIESNTYILPMTGQYRLMSSELANDDKVIKLSIHNDFFGNQPVILRQTGLISLVQHAPNLEELQNYFDLDFESAQQKNIATENLNIDQTIVANFKANGQVLLLPFPLAKTTKTILPNTMLAYCYGDRFWQKQVHHNPNHYFRCFHRFTHEVIHQLPVRRAFWFEINGKPIKPLLIHKSDIGKDIAITIGKQEYILSGSAMRDLIQQYPYATMLKLVSK